MRRAYGLVWMAGLMLGSVAATAHGQAIKVHAPSVHTNSLLGNTLMSLSATPASMSINLVPQSQAYSATPVAITSILTNPLLTTVNIYGYFLSSSAALVGQASLASIPSSCVWGIMPTGVPTTYTAFTQATPLSGAAAGLRLVTLTGLTLAHTETDNLTLKIDLSTLPQLPADTYVGTLYLQAQIF